MRLATGSPKFGIALKIALFSWLATLLTLLLFVLVILPVQKRSFEANLASKAQGLSASLQDVIAGAAVTGDYSSVVDHCRQVLQGDETILYIVITKNDGFSLIQEAAAVAGAPAPAGGRPEPLWHQDTLDASWHPALRQAASGIGTIPLFGRRVFHSSRPFDYSGIEWGWIHVGLSLDAYDRSVASVYRRTGILAVSCVVLSLLFSIYYARHLVGPIRALQAVLQRVSDGDLSARAAIRSGDEVESLAESFNTMTSTLLQRDRILEGVRLAAQDFLFAVDWDQVIGAVLARLGQSTLASRTDLYILSQGPDGSSCLDHRCAWAAGEEATPALGTGMSFPEEAGLSDLLMESQRNGLIAGPCREMPMEVQLMLEPFGVRSLILAPIMVGGICWGFFTLSECRRERVWTDAEKDSLRALADMMGATVARHRTQAELLEAKATLEHRVSERTAELQEQMAAKERAHVELAEAQALLMDVSRQAGMAEVATGVLHNVGNVLNSVNVSTTLIREKLRASEVDTLVELNALFQRHRPDLPAFLAEDPIGKDLLPFLDQLTAQIRDEHALLLKEQDQLATNIEHIKEIVNMQQNYARVSGYLEKVSLASLTDDALRLNAASLLRKQVQVTRDYADLSPVMLDKHRVMQILVNLIQNAVHAVEGAGGDGRRLTLTIARPSPERVAVSITDNGIGIVQENLTRIFSHGFSTKLTGHGFGLHSGALAAKAMGGSLTARSQGAGRGATFTLELPVLEHSMENRSNL
jgi:signal transduction histidine kinase/HAMP domain-containing protein